MSNRRAHMAIFGAARESDPDLRNGARCAFPPITEQRGEPVAAPYALHVGMGWFGPVSCAVAIVCGEEKPNRVVHEWKRVTCKRCLGVKSGAHVVRKKSARPRAAKSETKPEVKKGQTALFEEEKEKP